MAENETKKSKSKSLSPAEELEKAVEKARKAGLEVRVAASEMNEDGVSTDYVF